jgi:hypothetical protein
VRHADHAAAIEHHVLLGGLQAESLSPPAALMLPPSMR